MSTPIFENRYHFAPMFEISLESGAVSNAVLRDVQEVTYTEAVTGFDTFEFVLNDWDAATQQVKYSSPFDDNGQVRKVNGEPVPNFDPGTLLSLKMGYYGEVVEPSTMMRGRVISVAPSFPSSGTPTVRYRAISELAKFQKEKKSIAFEEPKKPSEIFSTIARDELNVQSDTPNQANEASLEYLIMADEYPIIFLWRLAKRVDYEIRLLVDPDTQQETLFFGPRAETSEVIELTWGQSLIDFSPQIKIKNLVSKVVVKGWNPVQSGESRQITGEATLDDIDPQLPDSQLRDQIGNAIGETLETVVNEIFESEDEANQRARDILTNLTRDMVTGSGTCIGDPRVRAGAKLQLSGMGPRFDGEYLVKQSTHTLGNSGYTVKFACELSGVVT
ncbi:phage late control D family protein [Alteromonadaceae bacterium M269]|nr:phage late control D family protein [Alteromonadaceae bacterium M269]